MMQPSQTQEPAESEFSGSFASYTVGLVFALLLTAASFLV
jgi:heme/copper-type cytochrome/quinol oxidase subunit 4